MFELFSNARTILYVQDSNYYHYGVWMSEVHFFSCHNFIFHDIYKQKRFRPCVL